MRIQNALVLVVALIAVPLVAQSNDFGVWFSTAKIKDTGDASGRLNFDDAKGHTVSFNHFWTGSVSTELSGTWLRADGRIEVDGTPVIDVGRLEIDPVVLNAQWHFARASMFSPYIGGGVAYVRTDELSNNDLDLAGIGTVKIDKKTTWDANAGIVVAIWRRFAVAADAKYIKYEPDAVADTGTEKLKLNPLVLSFGVKLRF